MVPPYSDRITRVPPYFSLAQYHRQVFTYRAITYYGRPFHAVLLTRRLSLEGSSNSLATTIGISVDFFSSGYLDVSVLQVRFNSLCIELLIPLRVGFPIQTSPDQSLFASSPKLFAGYHVFHRL